MNKLDFYNLFYNRLLQEDRELTDLTGQGIFYAPELYIAFVLGKEIKKKEQLIFGQEDMRWIRETDIGAESPTDFAFVKEGKQFAFEMKLRSTYHAYGRDVDKLMTIENYDKYFIALADTYEDEKTNDGRLRTFEKEQAGKIKRIVDEFMSFNTEQTRYTSKQICCTLGIWQVDEEG